MKINIEAGEVVLSEVYSGIGIATDMGLFGIAQRDDGVEVMLDGKTVWTSNELPGMSEARVPGAPHEDVLASGKLSPAEEALVFGGVISDEDRPEIDRYMARVCLCGKPRSEHAHGGHVQEKTRSTPKRYVVTNVVGVTSECGQFIDAIERKLGFDR